MCPQSSVLEKKPSTCYSSLSVAYGRVAWILFLPFDDGTVVYGKSQIPFLFCSAEIKARAWSILGKHCTIELLLPVPTHFSHIFIWVLYVA